METNIVGPRINTQCTLHCNIFHSVRLSFRTSICTYAFVWGKPSHTRYFRTFQWRIQGQLLRRHPLMNQIYFNLIGFFRKWIQYIDFLPLIPRSALSLQKILDSLPPLANQNPHPRFWLWNATGSNSPVQASSSYMYLVKTLLCK